MTKLQKSLKQQQRLSVRNSPHVAKLTPAEIRSLNHSALASKAGSQSSSKGASPARSRRSTNVTPPASLDHPPASEAQKRNSSISRHSSLNITTPPITPTDHRRSSQSSRHGPSPVQAQGNGTPVHSPRPRGSTQAAFMVANGISSRPSSSGSSIYRGLPTYRGPEVTRTGSLNMLERPPPNIVANPLSYFSRPRQSVVGSSPDRGRHHSQDSDGPRAQSLRSARTKSLHSLNDPPSRPASPPRVTDSPVSMLVEETGKFSVLDVDDPHNQPKLQGDDEGNKPDAIAEQIKEETANVPASSIGQQTQIQEEQSPKKDPRKRFTIVGGLFGKDRNGLDGSDSTGKLKKIRRRTMSAPKEREIEKPAAETCTHATVKEGSNMEEATAAHGDFATHPAVRPLSLIIPAQFEGKEKQIDAGPVYARCDCCGKLKRPPGFASELSPVLENENLRTNFSFEIERTSLIVRRRRSSDVSRDKFTPIIPIEVGENETRQAAIEPYKGPKGPVSPVSPVSPPRQPILASKASPRKSKRHSDPPRFVRFGSLHGRRNTDPTVIDEEEEVEVEVGTPMEDAGNFKIQDFAPVEEVSKSRPLVEQEGNGASSVEQYCLLSATTETAAPDISRPTTKPFQPPNFSRPARQTIRTIETRTAEQQATSGPTSPAEQPRSLLSLPEPSLGPQFARSNTILRSFVWESPKTVTDHDRAVLGMDLSSSPTANGGGAFSAAMSQPQTQLLDPNHRKGHKWVAEVMAV
ncbi:hypothetical protein A1O1_04841 [Capronia coronata CBS 617.96]|uniref:Uncharacterized protein n=1 Tax=Capronia coronata CBS 617.96 TaxID=1182541 RepID=W9Z067_9EURO|nr:uncharacterized protein A1O1_04841 [Capronia coronata CBS 617.96]EXJ87914.1 hypothetical protein A1O1_04841 [Capronia coronata CBS 617.96]